ncbi:MAG TPA: antitoxin Xre-like helix-turn-helix domain-containing protein, partial [Bryobacteraceae bacterium]|nr:antitoxin Xre-like helix-turn-helix domain-containing protein [Bryobacteraceae bacterium]
MVEASRIAGILGVRAASISDLSHKVEQGLPKQSLVRVARRVSTGKGEAGKLLVKVVPEATFKRRVRLTPHESERTERLARVIAAAEYVWGDRNDAREWLHTPHPELDRKPPLQAALTELGAR